MMFFPIFQDEKIKKLKKNVTFQRITSRRIFIILFLQSRLLLMMEGNINEHTKYKII